MPAHPDLGPRQALPLTLAAPRGWCAGVERAVIALENALEVHGAPVYVRGQVVHNEHVVSRLRAAGAVEVAELDEVPEGAVVVLSAHGVAPEVHALAEARGLRVIDTTCPLVTKVHLEARRAAREDREILLIGHEGHEEVIGTFGQARRVQIVASVEEARDVEVADPEHVTYLSQTTLSQREAERILAVLQARFPALQGPAQSDICYATQNRQDAVSALAEDHDLVVVVGSKRSSNSVRLAEVAEEAGSQGLLVEDLTALREAAARGALEGVRSVGVSAGASTPEDLVAEVVEWLREEGFDAPDERETAREHLRFAPPRLVDHSR